MNSYFLNDLIFTLNILKMEDYQKSELFFFCLNDCGFQNKIVVEFGSDFELHTAVGMRKLGAEKVICCNPGFPDDLISNDTHIVISKREGADTGLPDNSVDVVFGIALLEHVLEPQKMVEEIKRILKPQGIAYLSGCPIWTSPLGHHVWYQFPDKLYKFSDNTNPFYMWEHLYYETEEQVENTLRRKGLPEIHSKSIADFVINSNYISRKKASDIIQEVRQVEGIEISVHRSALPDKLPPEDLLSKYSKDDLNTNFLSIRIRKC